MSMNDTGDLISLSNSVVCPINGSMTDRMAEWIGWIDQELIYVSQLIKHHGSIMLLRSCTGSWHVCR